MKDLLQIIIQKKILNKSVAADSEQWYDCDMISNTSIPRTESIFTCVHLNYRAVTGNSRLSNRETQAWK